VVVLLGNTGSFLGVLLVVGPVGDDEDFATVGVSDITTSSTTPRPKQVGKDQQLVLSGAAGLPSTNTKQVAAGKGGVMPYAIIP